MAPLYWVKFCNGPICNCPYYRILNILYLTKPFPTELSTIPNAEWVKNNNINIHLEKKHSDFPKKQKGHFLDFVGEMETRLLSKIFIPQKRPISSNISLLISRN